MITSYTAALLLQRFFSRTGTFPLNRKRTVNQCSFGYPIKISRLINKWNRSINKCNSNDVKSVKCDRRSLETENLTARKQQMECCSRYWALANGANSSVWSLSIYIKRQTEKIYYPKYGCCGSIALCFSRIQENTSERTSFDLHTQKMLLPPVKCGAIKAM